jgi:DNA-binding beta-propeller fold protein YncE
LKRFPPALAAILLLGALNSARGQYVEDSIDVGDYNVASLVYNPSAGVVYGTCFYGRSVFVLACSTNELVARVPVTRPLALAYDSVDDKAYCSFSNQDADSLLIIDGRTHSRVRALELDGALYPMWDAVDNRLYVSCYGSEYDYVAVLDCTTDSVIASI